MSLLRIERVLALPGTVSPSTLYIVKASEADLAEAYFTNSDGTLTTHLLTKQEVVDMINTVTLMDVFAIDQTTPGSTNAVYPLETTELLEVVLSTDTLVYAAGDVLADTQPVNGVTRTNNGTAMLQNLIITDADDQGQPMDIVFLKANISLGTENAAVAITDIDAKEIIGIVSIAANDFIDLGGVRVAHVAVPAPIVLKAATGTTTVYIAAISRGTGTYTAGGISVKLGIIRV